MHKENLSIQQDMLNPVAFVASNNADTHYYHQAMKALDTKYFQKSIVKKFNAHVEIKHW